MSISFWIFLSSGALLALFFLLFAYEEGEGRRLVLARTRAYADLKIAAWQVRLRRRRENLKSWHLKSLLHFLFHQTITALLAALAKIESILHALRHHSQTSGVTTSPNHRPVGHLYSIAEHKAELRRTGWQDSQAEENDSTR